MITTLIACVVAGMVIGLRSKVLMIVPAIVVAAIAAAVVAIARGEHAWAVIGFAALGAIAIQIGYVCASLAASMLKETPTADAPAATAEPNLYRTPMRLNPSAESVD